MTSPLHEMRLDAVVAALRACGPESVLDLGCGDGDLVLRLVDEPRVERIVAIDPSRDALDRLRRRLGERRDGAESKVALVEGTPEAHASHLNGFEAAALVEVIEHVDPDRLSALERAVFAVMRPRAVVITTPNADFNPLLGVPAHRFRHPDHRFEWGRAKFRAWAAGVGGRNGYAVEVGAAGDAHPAYGGASQMATFRRIA